MRHIIPILLCLALFLAACSNVGVGMGVGVGGGNTRFGLGVSTGLDFLRGINGGALDNNKRGLEEFRAEDYEAARKSFEYTLKHYPDDPDAMYYLGLSRIYLGDREEGLDILKEYEDPKFRVQQEVRWWANYCARTPDMTPDDIHKALRKARAEGYNQDRQEYIDTQGW